jgi:ABC-type transporter Mla maintaining outer membrane lipid asymmetry permease subunit MlaE
MPTEDSENDPPLIPANPVVVVQGVGHLSREFMREVGSLFWFMVQTLDETVERIREGRVSISCLKFLPPLPTSRCWLGSAGRSGFIFSRPDHGFANRIPLQRFGTERLVPGLVAIAFTRELGPLITGIMLAARIGAAFTAELGTMQVSEEVEAIEAMGIGPLRFLVAPRAARTFSSHAMSLDHCESGCDLRQLSHLSRLFQHCLCLFSRPCPRRSSHS